jgi:hypothetical protein
VTFIKHARVLVRAQRRALSRALSAPGQSGAAGRRSARATHGRLGLTLILLAMFLSGAPDAQQLATAHAQDGAGSDWESGPSESRCSPRCRSGFECKHSECVPVCSPACGAGYLCTAGGSCVRTDGPPPPMSSNQGWGASNNQCLPSCRSGYTCVSGQCVSLCNPICPAGEYCTERGECAVGNPEPEGAAAATQSQPEKAAPGAPAKSSSADSIINLHFDALGLLQFGLTPTLEVGKKFAGYLRVRPMNTGLLSYFLLAEDGGKFQWGLGAALGLHIFSAGAGNMRGVFGGPALEYVYVQTKNTTPAYLATYGTHALIPQIDLGYRWAFDSFLLGLGGRVGVSIPVAHFDEPIGGNDVGCPITDPTDGPISCDGKRSIYFVAGIFVDIGVFL